MKNLDEIIRNKIFRKSELWSERGRTLSEYKPLIRTDWLDSINVKLETFKSKDIKDHLFQPLYFTDE